MEYDETARLKKRYKNEGLLGDAELSSLKSLLQTKIAPESAGARSLLDVLQAASNMSAENVSAPVEGIAWLLEKAGMPIKDPVLGQKWMADRGLTRPVKEGAQKVIGDTAGMLLPFAGTKAGAQAIAKGLLDIGENGLPVGMSTKADGGMGFLDQAIDELTGLPLNKDGTVTVYHHTNKAAADQINKTGKLKSAGEPSVYVTTHKTADTGYGDVVVPVNVKPSVLNLDDEFPGGRLDFSIDVKKPGGYFTF